MNISLRTTSKYFYNVGAAYYYGYASFGMESYL